MPEIVYFINVRQDGGRRCGIEVDSQTAWHHFEPGQEDIDPSLEWWVDVACRGDRLPTEPLAVRDWLLEPEHQIARLLQLAASDIDPVGFDVESMPFRRQYSLGGVEVAISASAARRVVARQMSENLGKLAQNWDEIIRELELPANV